MYFVVNGNMPEHRAMPYTSTNARAITDAHTRGPLNACARALGTRIWLRYLSWERQARRSETTNTTGNVASTTILTAHNHHRPADMGTRDPTDTYCEDSGFTMIGTMAMEYDAIAKITTAAWATTPLHDTTRRRSFLTV